LQKQRFVCAHAAEVLGYLFTNRIAGLRDLLLECKPGIEEGD
jgi:hypothetical protein